MKKGLISLVAVIALGASSYVFADGHKGGYSEDRILACDEYKDCKEKNRDCKEKRKDCDEKKGYKDGVKACDDEGKRGYKGSMKGCDGDKKGSKKGKKDNGDRSFAELMFALNGLNLTSEQRGEIGVLMVDMKFAKKDLREKSLQKSALQDALKSGKFNEAVFVDKMTEKSKEYASLKAKFFTQVLSVLTPEQIVELNEYIVEK